MTIYCSRLAFASYFSVSVASWEPETGSHYLIILFLLVARVISLI